MYRLQACLPSGTARLWRQPEAELTEEIVKDYCLGKIARFKIPKYVIFVDEYPLTGSGKIQKFKLKDIGLKYLASQGVKID